MEHTNRRPCEPLPVPAAELVARANARVRTLGLDEARELIDDPSYLFVDIRDPREWEAHGIIPGAYRAPRGMLEFWVDPESPYFKPALDDGRTLILYCGSAWRSALAAAALHDMGRTDVTHLEGGFSAWTAAGLPSESYPAG
ncbi:MAG: rhodanese-like domain-containing protein [Corynebacterium sp.]|uniref:rhodanese-like domain-containing protein n=1 Tax=Corynebacterium sp. TaxID=1720 RepID=UPI0026DF02A6|nr:rhodanese-like domain-containing protein [Corynebacterium sp.]MDO5668514.1 rhodanese-like domain-containing protein [Corynebacterium sp.]